MPEGTTNSTERCQTPRRCWPGYSWDIPTTLDCLTPLHASMGIIHCTLTTDLEVQSGHRIQSQPDNSSASSRPHPSIRRSAHTPSSTSLTSPSPHHHHLIPSPRAVPSHKTAPTLLPLPSRNEDMSVISSHHLPTSSPPSSITNPTLPTAPRRSPTPPPNLSTTYPLTSPPPHQNKELVCPARAPPKPTTQLPQPAPPPPPNQTCKSSASPLRRARICLLRGAGRPHTSELRPQRPQPRLPLCAPLPSFVAGAASVSLCRRWCRRNRRSRLRCWGRGLRLWET